MVRDVYVLCLGLLIGAGMGFSAIRAARPEPPTVHTTEVLPHIFLEQFERGALGDWREHVRHGHTRYQIVSETGEQYLEATAVGAASALIHPLRFQPRPESTLIWTWRVKEPLAEADLAARAASDAAARLYLVFSTGKGFWQKQLLIYVWAAHEPLGAVVPNPYGAAAKFLVVESGTAQVGQWVREERNVAADYRAAFGGDPPPVEGIALMTDSDNTGARAQADYDDIRVIP